MFRGRWHLTLPDGKRPSGLYTLIFRKLPEGWKIVHDHTSAAEPPPPPATPQLIGSTRSFLSRLRRGVRVGISFGLVLGTVLGTVGQVVRDRSVGWALLMYLPLIPMGLAAVVWDAIGRGRALPRPRFLLAAIGLVAAVGASVPMVGFGPNSSRSTGEGPEISVLHWNVVWGGGKRPEPGEVGQDPARDPGPSGPTLSS